MSDTPEHDKIEKLRRSSPIAADFIHLMLDTAGWMIVNETVNPPVRMRARKVFGELAGIDVEAYSLEVAARLGVSTLRPDVVDTVIDWAQQEAAWEELHAQAAASQESISKTVAETVGASPLGAAAVNGLDSLTDSNTVLAVEPDVPESLRGTIFGQAITLGILTAEEALRRVVPAPTPLLVESPQPEVEEVAGQPGLTAPDLDHEYGSYDLFAPPEAPEADEPQVEAPPREPDEADVSDVSDGPDGPEQAPVSVEVYQPGGLELVETAAEDDARR